MQTYDLFARQAVLEWIEADLEAGYRRQHDLRLKRAAAAHRGIAKHREIHGRAR